METWPHRAVEVSGHLSSGGTMVGPADRDEVLVGFGNDDGLVGEFPVADPRYADFSPEDVATVEAVWSYTVTSPERIYALIRSVEHVVANSIPGDIVECGVWRGGSTMVVARTLLSLQRDDRILWL